MPVGVSWSGFWGKLPSRGDFSGTGLPGDFTAAWDGWVSAGLAAAIAALGDRFAPLWLTAPVWRFAAAGGLFGAAPVGGLWMPSVDKAGRFFPLVFAAAGGASSAWLDGAEAAGRAALDETLAPDEVAARLPEAEQGAALAAGSRWWTEGSPHLAAAAFDDPALPAPFLFPGMLEDGACSQAKVWGR